MLTEAEVVDVLGAFPDADISIINHIIYFNGWQSDEECGGILIFEGIDGSAQLVNYGTSVFSSQPDSFTPHEITSEEVDQQIKEMEELLKEYAWPAC